MKPAFIFAILAFLGLTTPQGLMAAQSRINNIVLVHGAFTDGSSWQDVVADLQSEGYHVTAVQNPLSSLDDDVKATGQVIDRQQGDVLLVGHSWGGAVITQAGNHPKVKRLAYLSALAPDSGESAASLLTRLNAPMEGLHADQHGLIWLDDPVLYHRVMANDVSHRRTLQLTATQQPIAARAFHDIVQHAAWRDKPSWYLLTENDHALAPHTQQQLAAAMGSTVTRINASHMSMVSHAGDVVRFIERATQLSSKETQK